MNTQSSDVVDLLASGRLGLEQKHSTELGDGRTLSLTVVTLAGRASEPPHTHPGFEILYVVSGTGYVELDGVRTPLASGHAVHVPEGTVKAITNDGDTPLTVLAVLVLDPDRPPFIPAPGRTEPDRPH